MTDGKNPHNCPWRNKKVRKIYFRKPSDKIKARKIRLVNFCILLNPSMFLFEEKDLVGGLVYRDCLNVSYGNIVM